MEQFREHNLAKSDSFSLVLDEAPESLNADFEGGDEVDAASDESSYTDDPVRVYLREMGSVSLLTRQGEVDLARRMERGKLRVQKVLSRSPMVQQMVVAVCEDLRHGKVELGDLIEISASDEAGGERKRAEAMRRFTKVGKLNRDLRAMEKKLASTPHRYVHVRARVVSQAGPAKDQVLAGDPRNTILLGKVDDLRERVQARRRGDERA